MQIVEFTNATAWIQKREYSNSKILMIEFKNDNFWFQNINQIHKW